MQPSDSVLNDGRVLHVCISERKGVCKKEVSSARVVAGYGLEGDAHAGDWHRQVSLLAHRDIEYMRAKGLTLVPGAFGENLVLDGIKTSDLGVGTRLQVGPVLLELSQIGKVCHTRCAIYYKTGDCIMPRLGLFARVIQGGVVAPGMRAVVISGVPSSTIQAAVMTASDRCSKGEMIDTAGPAVARLLQERLGAHIAWTGIRPDDLKDISSTLKELVERKLDLIVTVGGTGISPRDVTPEATRLVLQRELPGFSEAMRARSMQITPSALLSRAVAGISGESLIINLPGSRKASAENLTSVLPALRHAVDMLRNNSSHEAADKGRLISVHPAEPDSEPALQAAGARVIREAAGRFCAPVLAVSGFSGSGKTTLLEAAIPELIRCGISVAVVKHDAHGVQIDHPGKDSDRLFRAGATVALRGPDQQFLRRRGDSLLSLHATLEFLSYDHDLLLVEGHKDTPLPKFWLENATQDPVPGDITNIVEILRWNTNRVEKFVSFVKDWLPIAWRNRPIFRGLLLDDGNRSTDLAPVGGLDLALLGSGPLPRDYRNLPHIPDAPDIDSPFAPLISAHRWAPAVTWIIGSDRQLATSSFADWLISLRAPGRWAVIPMRQGDAPLSIDGLYEPQALTLLERNAMQAPGGKVCIDTLIGHPRTLMVEFPVAVQPDVIPQEQSSVTTL